MQTVTRRSATVVKSLSLFMRVAEGRGAAWNYPTEPLSRFTCAYPIPFKIAIRFAIGG